MTAPAALGKAQPEYQFPSVEDLRDERDRLRAINAELLGALDTLLDLCPRMSDDDPIAPAIADACRDARAAITKAKP